MKLALRLFILFTVALMLPVFLSCPDCPDCHNRERETQMENDVQREDEKNLPDKEKHNRLFKENSPYLLQHSTNPVDWYPWGEEAFEQARKEDKPIFLSAGYSTCHWCHVMERESFERDDVAEIMNSRYVSIKVDREERPDIDEIYMAATQLMTGRGGWPNSVWLTPDGKPWYAGTYFPREDVGAMAGFKTMLLKLAEVWQTRKEEALAQADKISSTIEQISRGRAPTSGGGISRELVAGAIEQMKQNYDGENGGFGKAPKFPPHPSLKLLFYEHGRTGDKDSLDMADAILEAMASGGIRDHIGGGFHRYSTDEKWFLPHFEKMLYDNAQLLRAYTIGFLLVGRESYKRVAGEIAEWVLDEMSDPEGGFYGAIDADSEGEEGKHYVWKKDEIIEILGEEDGEIFCRIYGIENEGNYLDEATGARPGTNVIYMKESPGNELVGKIQSMKKKLLKERKTRPRPHLDEKIIAGWNGLMLGSLAYAGSALGMPEYIETAQRAGEFIFEKMYDNGRLKRYRREGRTGSVAFLDDYAFCAEGLLELHEAAGEERWLRECKKLMDTLIGHYIDRGAGGFFFTSDEHEKLIIRPKSLHDRALPSGNGVALGVLVRLHEKTGDGKYLEIVQSSLKSFLPEMKTSPGTVQTIIHAAGLYLDSQNEKVS